MSAGDAGARGLDGGTEPAPHAGRLDGHAVEFGVDAVEFGVDAVEFGAHAVESVARDLLGARGPLGVERVRQGSSTPVYRLDATAGTCYLRVGEHGEHRLEVEVAAHAELRRLGVRVPEVVAHAPFDERLQRPVMIVASLTGAAVGDSSSPGRDVAAVYRAAGRDLARVASVRVDGFGFVTRDDGAGWPPRAPHPTAAAALLECLDGEDLEGLLRPAEASIAIGALHELVADVDRLTDGYPAAVLAHGDVDPSHVFHLDGRYTGMIDLGELRGALPGDDLARFRLWEGEGPALDALTTGYAEVAPLPTDHDERCRHLAVLQGAQQLARWRRRDGAGWATRDTVRRLADRVSALLTAS